ncbi:MAG: serine/threonine-protein kinase [Mycobacterium sp.]|nr:serine/threonine-protein kinase [Mycobacterium sp.]
MLVSGEESPQGGETAECRTGSQFGPYLLKRLLGSGGFGEVYEAVDTVKNRIVALKLLPPSCTADPNFRRRLFREASTAGRLNEPHVVPIHDYGEIEGQLYIDMRLIPGTDLRTVLSEEGPLDVERAVSITAQIAAALDAAHAEEIVHRDVKPANILLAAGDFACLVDFGLANAATDAQLTSAGTTIGTFAYMAPERFGGLQIDRRVDVYALACVLHECLTGVQPYQASDKVGFIAAHIATPIPQPSSHPGVPAAFDEVISRGMAKDPKDRYLSAGELAAAARGALAGAGPGPARAAAPEFPAAAQAPGRRRRRRIAVLAAAAVVAAAAGTASWMFGRHQDHHPAPVTGPQAAPVARIVATVPVGRRPEAVAVDSASHNVYTVNYEDSTLSAISTARWAVTATIPVGHGPAGLAIDPGAHTAVVANNRDDTATIIDLAAGTPTATVKVGTNPWGVAIDPDSHSAYVANQWDYSVSVINLDTRSVIATIPVGKNPYGVAVDPTTHAAYVANSSDGTVSVIDGATRAVTATIPVGNDPRGVAIDAAHHAAFVTNEAEGTVTVINLDSRRLTATVHLGDSPFGVAVDPAAHTVYSANHDNALSVIDTNTLAVTGAIRIGKDTFTVDVDPATHIVYTATADNAVAAIDPAQH